MQAEHCCQLKCSGRQPAGLSQKNLLLLVDVPFCSLMGCFRHLQAAASKVPGLYYAPPRMLLALQLLSMTS